MSFCEERQKCYEWFEQEYNGKIGVSIFETAFKEIALKSWLARAKIEYKPKGIDGLSNDPATAYEQGRKDGSAETISAVEISDDKVKPNNDTETINICYNTECPALWYQNRCTSSYYYRCVDKK